MYLIGTEDSSLHNKGLRECYSDPNLCTMKLEENSKLQTSFTTSPLLIAWPLISSKGDCEGEGKEGPASKGEDTAYSNPDQRVELCSNGRTRLAANGAGDGGDDDDDENKNRKNRKKPLPPSDFMLEEKEQKNKESSSQERMEVDEFHGSQNVNMEYSEGEKSDWSMTSLEQNEDVPSNLQPQATFLSFLDNNVLVSVKNFFETKYIITLIFIVLAIVFMQLDAKISLTC